MASGRLASIEGKALTDFVERAGGTEEAFVEKEFVSDKPCEGWLTPYCSSEYVEALPLTPAFTARESDVRLVGTILGDKPTMPRRRSDMFLKVEQFRRESYVYKENAGAIEEAQSLKRGWDGR